MGIKNTLLEHNPINNRRIKRLRQRMGEQEITILSSNYLGGLVYHELGLKFCSPTVNTRFDSPDFVKFVAEPKRYLEAEFTPLQTEETHPVAMLDDITVHFVHYSTVEEGIEVWNKRKERIRWDRTFAILNDCDGITTKDLELLKNSPIKNICVFTAKPYPEYDFCFYLPRFAGRECVGNTMNKSIVTGEMVVEKDFDFVG